jgi:hypothetical protein
MWNKLRKEIIPLPGIWGMKRANFAESANNPPEHYVAVGRILFGALLSSCGHFTR